MKGTIALSLLLTLVSPAVKAQEAEAAIAAVENSLLPAIIIQGEPLETAMMNILERMAYYHVPGVSIAVIDQGELVWAKGYGVLEAGGTDPITPETLFQAASISKAVTATAAMELVETAVLELDDDVNGQLHAWQIPDNALTEVEKVTLRRLLSHTAGLTVSGFPGYAAGESVPTAIQVLDGAAPANTEPVRVDIMPGSEARYSGGGYTVLQVLLEDVTGKPFPELMQDLIFELLGMASSTFEQPLPPALSSRAASGHQPDGTPVAGKWHTYPELAAAGLWTTPTDLAYWLIALQQSVVGEAQALLSKATTDQMLTDSLGASYGLGLRLGGSGSSRWFGHDGSNAGFFSSTMAFSETGQGVAVMTNSDSGFPLVQEIIRGIAHVYDWPDLQPIVKAVTEVDPAIYSAYVGEYVGVAPVAVTQQEDRLFLVLPPMFGGEVALYPESETQFFALNGMEVTFQKDADGNVSALTITTPELRETPPFVRQP